MTTTTTQANGPAPAAAPKTKPTQAEIDTLATVPARWKACTSIDAVAAAIDLAATRATGVTPQRVEDIRPVSARTAASVRRVLASDAERVTLASSASRIGKTSFAVAFLAERARMTGMPGLFVDANALASDPDLVARAISCPGAVLIDALGEEADAAHSPVPRIVSARFAEMRTTVATTILNREKAEVVYGVGLARRMFDTKTGAEIIDPAMRS